MVGVDDGSLQDKYSMYSRLTAQVSWLGLRVDGRLAISLQTLHSLNEPGELSQWPCIQNYKYWHYYYYYYYYLMPVGVKTHGL